VRMEARQNDFSQKYFVTANNILEEPSHGRA
jgi:hypothetical protein